jgi:hypothetical protein
VSTIVDQLVQARGRWGWVLRHDDDLVVLFPERGGRGEDRWACSDCHASTPGGLVAHLAGSGPWELLRSGELVLAGHGREVTS